ncbi:Phosphatidylserine/phosphatidylglycerophosphate/cardiolipin synthase [Amycolatopsis arida]|uniref:phospholipase D n=1 Tax=Amycolatopsis arida TaxID=587909 RepID=A0A1I5KGM8_9PSEU|nr:phospholipase D-like domain-containing protein [Amycolatopsis arida]TDX97037.1 phosphatidylserine/phosphatidylglycerophosphate/cardiolipin synthase-like enzyme [Amycolatopsis arida]SFO84180.1 Phosphatidylserine/phosphatidylglycerophosphate/cardiolipin synthase [Amycolatopsis arida]
MAIRTRRGFGAAVVVALAAGLLGVAAPATATAVTPTTGAVFNNPYGSAAEQYAIRDHVVNLVRATEPGATISTSIYNITDHERGVADALVAAARRGVRVRVVLESEKAGTGSAQAIVSGLGRDRSKPSWAVVCASGCHGTKINHNKFYLFSEVGGKRNVVVQSSANLTISNARKYWNNAVTFVENPELYQGYLGYFGDLARDRRDDDYYRTVGAGNVKAYFFPRGGSGASSDTVYNTLGNVRCTGNTQVGTSDGRTIIRIGMWYFGRDAIADRLAALGRAGCRIDIAYTEMLDGPAAELRGVPNVTLRRVDRDGYIIHSKYMLIEGTYAEVANRKVVFTGSHNYSNAALHRNDEAMVRIYSNPIHDQYAANFAAVLRSLG